MFQKVGRKSILIILNNRYTSISCQSIVYLVLFPSLLPNNYVLTDIFHYNQSRLSKLCFSDNFCKIVQCSNCFELLYGLGFGYDNSFFQLGKQRSFSFQPSIIQTCSTLLYYVYRNKILYKNQEISLYYKELHSQLEAAFETLGPAMFTLIQLLVTSMSLVSNQMHLEQYLLSSWS